MKVVVPQISWHGKEPILSIDFDPSSKGEDGSYRLATGGGDCQLNIWLLSALDTFTPDLTCVAELKRHEKTVNVVRFSPDGSCIATGGDDAYVILWKRGGGAVTMPSFPAGGDGDDPAAGEEEGNKEDWTCDKVLRKHVNDVADLSWSADSNFLLSGSIDNSAVLWDVKKGIATHVWSEKDHSGFVHGVAYDPLSEFAATMCIDRNLRFFDIKNKKVAHKVLKYPDEWLSQVVKIEDEDDAEKGKENLPKSEDVKNKEEPEAGSDVPLKKKHASVVNRIFHDEFLSTFCRRLTFSPKGELLMVPGGLLPPTPSQSQTPEIEVIELKDEDVSVKSPEDDEKKAGSEKKDKKKEPATNNAVILFCRNSWTTPVAIIPTKESFSIATRFSPVYYTKQREAFDYGTTPMFPKKGERSFACVNKLNSPKEEKHVLLNMPYRLVYAVATNDSVLIGDTVSHRPLAIVRNIHLARISDVSWAANGQALIVSSIDGYCSIVSFEKGELGQEFVVQEAEEFPVLRKFAFPILPPEPKPTPKRKTPKAKQSQSPRTDNETNKTDMGKTPKSSKGKKSTAEHPKNSLFSKLVASATPCPKQEDTADSATGVILNLPIENTTEQGAPVTLQGLEHNGLKQTDKEGAAAASSSAAPPSLSIEQKSESLAPKSKTPNTILSYFKKTSTPVAEKPEVDSETVKPADPNDSQGEAHSAGQEKKKAAHGSTAEGIPLTLPNSKSKTQTPVAAHRRLSANPLRFATPSPLKNGRRHSASPMPITPEELHKLTTAPLKFRTLEEPKLIMQSSNAGDRELEAAAAKKDEEAEAPIGSIKINNQLNLSEMQEEDEEEEEEEDAARKMPPPAPPGSGSIFPNSPVTSSAPRPPRRITLTSFSSKNNS